MRTRGIESFMGDRLVDNVEELMLLHVPPSGS
jgi:hypothetical protein